MRYNNIFRMRDLFMNDKLSHVFPQLEISDLSGDILADEFIFKKTQELLASATNGRISGDSVEMNGDENEIKKKITVYKNIIEGFFDNIPSIVNGVKRNTRVYTTLASIDQLKGLTSTEMRFFFMKQVLENVQYNPNFGNAQSGELFLRRQQAWQRKVNFK